MIPDPTCVFTWWMVHTVVVNVNMRPLSFQFRPRECVCQRWYRGFEPAWGGRKKQSSGAGSIPKKGRGLPEKQSSAAAGAPKKGRDLPEKQKSKASCEKSKRDPLIFLLPACGRQTHTDPDPGEEAFILLDHRG